MAAIGASDVTYTVQGKVNIMDDGRRRALMKIQFGDGALTYPTGGIALSGLSSAGFPRVIAEVSLMDESNADGYVYKYDYANNKLLMYRSAGFTPAGTVAAPVFTGSALSTHVHDFKVIGSQAAAGTDAISAKTLTLGKEAATDITIAGADSATLGGVVAVSGGTPAGTNSAPAFTGTAVAAGALVEVASSVAPAATSLYAVVIGY